MMEALRLSGIDLTPLPYESSLGVLLRLCWRNAIDGNILAELLGLKKIYPTQTFSKVGWLKTNLLSLGPDWSIPRQDEAQVLETFGELASTFFSRTFRVCPICIGAAYHSYWHQFVLIETCPIHAVPLTANCIECGESLPPYSFNKPLFKRPYQCHHCKHPIVGDRISIGKHLNLRSDLDLLTKSMESLYNMFELRRETIAFLNELQPFYGGAITNIGDPLDTHALVKEVFLNTVDRPGLGLVSKRSEMTVLSWSIHVASCGSSRGNFPRAFKPVNERLASAVYRSTIRYLRDWIIRSAVSGTNCTNEVEFEDGKMCLEGASSHFLAYHLTRMAFEDYQCEPIDSKLRFFDLRFDVIPSSHSHGGRQPRLSWRAIFFSVYASMFWRVEHSRKEGPLLNLREIRTRMDPAVTKAVFRQQENSLSGYVVFPTVPGMPTWPFKNTRLSSATRF